MVTKINWKCIFLLLYVSHRAMQTCINVMLNYLHNRFDNNGFSIYFCVSCSLHEDPTSLGQDVFPLKLRGELPVQSQHALLCTRFSERLHSFFLFLFWFIFIEHCWLLIRFRHCKMNHGRVVLRIDLIWFDLILRYPPPVFKVLTCTCDFFFWRVNKGFR